MGQSYSAEEKLAFPKYKKLVDDVGRDNFPYDCLLENSQTFSKDITDKKP